MVTARGHKQDTTLPPGRPRRLPPVQDGFAGGRWLPQHARRGGAGSAPRPAPRQACGREELLAAGPGVDRGGPV
jgi:hypothetical protein